MSICGYLGPNHRGPLKKSIMKGATGPVLSGAATPQSILYKDSVEGVIPQQVFGIELFGPRQPWKKKRCNGEWYSTVDAYDPVLLSHCFQLEPKPPKDPQS